MTTRRPGHRVPPLDDDAETVLRFRAKQELRKRIRLIRRRIPPEHRERRSKAITAALEPLPVWQNARTIAGYAAMPDEVDPSTLLSEARHAGRRIALPRVEADGTTMTFRVAEEDLELHPLGFRQPAADSSPIVPSEIDVILVPALAVDLRGHRLGYGGGFYDRTLPTLGHATAVALVFHFQLMAELPNTSGDVAVQFVVTDEGVFEADGAE